MSKVLIFIVVGMISLLLAWHFYLEEEVMVYLNHVPVQTNEFEINAEATYEQASFDFEGVTYLGWDGLLPYVDEPVYPTGQIILPTLDISLPILHGVSDVNMSRGAGTLSSDQMMAYGNYGLASHNVWHPQLLFSAIDDLKYGDVILLHDGIYFYVYEVTVNAIIERYRVDVLDDVEGETLVTLITCTDDGLQRVMVQGEYVGRVSKVDLLSGMEDELTQMLDVTHVVALIEEVPAFPWLQVIGAVATSVVVGLGVVRLFKKYVDV